VLAARDQADPVRAMRYQGGVHPAYRGRGLGTALLDWAAGAAGVIHAGRFPGRPLSLQCGFPESDDRARCCSRSTGSRLSAISAG